MKILILTQWYPPEPGLLMQEFAQTLMAHGHQVTVLTGFPNYPSGQLYPGYRLQSLQREMIAGVPVVRVPLYPEHSHSGIKRAFNYLSFAASAATLGWFYVSKPDVMFVYHPPLTIGIPAYVLSRLWRIPFVYQIQDMWPETLSATGMLNNVAALKTVGRFAKWVYEKAAAICVISPGFRENLIKKGVPADKVHVISNWVDPDTYYVADPDSVLAKEFGMSNRFNVMYAGNIGEAQGLEVVLEAAHLLQDMNAIQFVFVGDGSALPHLKQLAKLKCLSNVRFLGRYPENLMPRLYALAQLHLVHLRDHQLFRITIPHKIFTCMASGKPILVAMRGDAANIINNLGAGNACIPQDPKSMVAAILSIYAMDEAERKQLGERGLAAVKNIYCREKLASKIEDVLMATIKL